MQNFYSYLKCFVTHLIRHHATVAFSMILKCLYGRFGCMFNSKSTILLKIGVKEALANILTEMYIR